MTNVSVTCTNQSCRRKYIVTKQTCMVNAYLLTPWFSWLASTCNFCRVDNIHFGGKSWVYYLRVFFEAGLPVQTALMPPESVMYQYETVYGHRDGPDARRADQVVLTPRQERQVEFFCYEMDEGGFDELAAADGGT